MPTVETTREVVEIIGSSIAILATLINVPRWLMFRLLWPNREKWSGECLPAQPDEKFYGDMRLNPKMAFDKKLGERWSQMREMRANDYYQLNIHKRRVISKVNFISEGYRYPERWSFYLKQSNTGEWVFWGEHEGQICIEFQTPVKLTAVKVVIIKPRIEPKNVLGQSPAWSIYNIELTEARIFGKYWKRVIV